VNTIRVQDEPPYPGGADAIAVEERLAGILRWNALAMVVRANRAYGELGGHIASYASAADLFEVGFNHFFRARSDDFAGDLIYFQPHSSPGIYARAFLEGRLNENNLAHYRQEISAASKGIQGLSSYPHPWLMPEFWQFPTGSMGIGPISSIYQARFMRYLEHRGMLATQERKVWGVFGDGEMDEPESTIWCLSSTAICNVLMARCVAMVISSMSWKLCLAEPAGTSSNCSGARIGIRFLHAISKAS
jgi:pyruvate dehydrogenase E1 component